MSRFVKFSILLSLGIVFPSLAQELDSAIVVPYEGESKVKVRHQMDMQGMIMNENKETLPDGCREISEDVSFTVHAGRKYAEKFNGKMFAYDQQEWAVKPCSRITIKFVNDDHIRHQFMIHGLPEYLYPPTGMFHIELTGPGSKTATFIVSDEPKTFLVHCELAQHMEYGMKAQMKVGEGDGDLPSVPGLTKVERPDQYSVEWDIASIVGLLIATLVGIFMIVSIGVVCKKRE